MTMEIWKFQIATLLNLQKNTKPLYMLLIE